MRVTLKATPSNRYASSGDTSRLKLLVELAHGSDGGTPRYPVNLCLLVDRSTSMHGEALTCVKEAARLLLDSLDPDDLVSLVGFDEVVSVLFPTASTDRKEAFGRAVESLEARGATNIHGALEVGGREVRKNRDPGRLHRILLLSDGEATAGVTEDERILELVASLAAEGISVSTLGLGEDYDERILARIARQSGGNHYYIRETREVRSMFHRELGEIRSVGVRNVRVRIDLEPGVRITWVNPRNPVRFAQGRVELSPGDVPAGGRLSTVLEFETEGQPVGLRTAMRLQATCEAMGEGSRPGTLETAVDLEFVASSALVRDGIDRSVLRRWEELKALESLDTILRKVKDREIDTRTAVLELDRRTQNLIKKKSLVVAKTLADFSKTMVEEGGITSSLSKKTMVDLDAIEKGRFDRTIVDGGGGGGGDGPVPGPGDPDRGDGG